MDNVDDIFDMCQEHRHTYTYVESMVMIEGDYVSKVDWHCVFFGIAPEEDITDCLQNCYDIEVEEDGYYLIKALLSTHTDMYDYGRYETWLEIEKMEIDYQHSLEELESDNPSTGAELFKLFNLDG